MRVRHQEQQEMRVKPEAVRVGPGALLIRHTITPTRTITPSPDPYHKTQSWRFENDTWKGEYRASGIRCPGEIWRHYGKFCARIMNCPDAVLNGPHAACFSPDAERVGWFRIHFADMPKSVDGAILAVENTLAEGGL